ncbi:unnamed protein product, partial [marine sediment metagenome]
ADGLVGRDYSEVVDDIGSSIDEVGTVTTGTLSGLGLLSLLMEHNPNDDTFAGIKILGMAGENLAFGETVHVEDDSTWTKGDADSLITIPTTA